jgi:hypothetical protein
VVRDFQRAGFRTGHGRYFSVGDTCGTGFHGFQFPRVGKVLERDVAVLAERDQGFAVTCEAKAPAFAVDLEAAVRFLLGPVPQSDRVVSLA